MTALEDVQRPIVPTVSNGQEFAAGLFNAALVSLAVESINAEQLRTAVESTLQVYDRDQASGLISRDLIRAMDELRLIVGRK